MTAADLQDRLDRLRATSRQRWALGVTAVVAATFAAVVAAGAGLGWGQDSRWILALVVAAAIGAAVAPASHLGLLAVAVVVVRWLAVVDDVTTAWSIVVAGCLLIFHTALALMAVTPPAATVPRPIVRRWLARMAAAWAAAGAVWLLVLAMDARRAPGNAWVTLAAFVVLLAATLAVRARTLDAD